jgi:predicted TIM-barrel fold metal-dependent hydrolase
MPTAAPPHILPRPEWLALRSEPVIDPEREIVDPHHHLWDRPGYRYLLPELLEDLAAGHRVVQTVFVQCRSMYRADGPVALRPVGEVEFVNGVAAMSASGLYGEARACAAIVGCADLGLGAEVAPVLEALERAGNGRLRGIRFPVAWHPDQAVGLTPQNTASGLMGEPAVRAGAAALARAGLSLDIWAGHTQLGELYDLAAAVPDLTIVIDHVGGPIGVGPYAGRRAEVLADWTAAMRRLAALPNLVVKLGGLAMRVGGFAFDEAPQPPSSQELAAAWRPYIVTCIDLFSPARCMFESNFPVDKGMVGYRALWNCFKRLAAEFSEDEKRALFAGTARRVYRLEAGPQRLRQ